MDSNRWKTIETLFHAVREMQPVEQRIYLEQACIGDSELLEAVLQLLSNQNEGQAFEQAVQRTALEVIQDECLSPGTRLGVYEIIDEIGRGGMGAVYRARRVDGLFDQTVAVKLVHGGRFDQSRLQRFTEERKILARLEHPNIARLIDGGATEDKLPYFLMEYVDGQPIDQYCEQNNLGETDRLHLFLQICAAVQFAHQKLVIHSDLKSSNIMVTKTGEVRLLDFGISRLVGAGGTMEKGRSVSGLDSGFELDQRSRSLANRSATPAYSSPEQLRGEAIGTSSDIYSLGVVLHEVLTGVLPDNSAGSLSSKLNTDMQSIVARAMSLQPINRYPSSAQMAEDVQRYLEGFPVSARSGNLAYRSGKFFRRNRVGSIMGGLLAVALLAFAMTAWFQARTVATERDQANAQRDRAEALADFLIDTMESVSPNQAQGREVTVREMLDNAANELTEGENALSTQVETGATLHRVMGTVYLKLGLREVANSQLQQALQFRRAELPVNNEELYKVLLALSSVRTMSFDFDSALGYLNEALQLSEAINGPTHRDTLGIRSNIANIYQGLGKFDAASELHETVYQQRLATLGSKHEDTLISMNNIAVVNHWRGDLEKARQGYQKCLDAGRAALGDRHTLTLGCLGRLGGVLETMGDYQRAKEVLTQHIELTGIVLSENHPDRLRSMHTLADALRGLGRYEESEAMFLDTLARRREYLGPSNVETLQTEYKLARLYGLMGRDEEARVLVNDAINQLSDQLGPDHPTTQTAKDIQRNLEAAPP